MSKTSFKKPRAYTQRTLDQQKYEPVYEKKMIFSKGKPIGSEKEDDMDIWNKSRPEIHTVEDLYNVYKYSELEEVFHWAVSFRAGLAMIYKDPTVKSHCEILLLEHPEFTTIDKKGNIDVRSPRLGPPKGGREDTDVSAVGTAIRETFEETGINILDPKYGAKLMPPAFFIRRPELVIPELMVYFIVIFEKKPEVYISKNEICGYKWVDMIRELRYVKNVTTPTYVLLNSLANTNLYGNEVLEAVEMPHDWEEFVHANI